MNNKEIIYTLGRGGLALILFLFTSFFITFLFPTKESLYQITMGFPFIIFYYSPSLKECSSIIWGWRGEALLLNIFIFWISYFVISYIVKIYISLKAQKIFKKILNIFILPISLFCTISLFTFFPFPLQNTVYNIYIGLPYIYYKNVYIGENCETLIREWNYVMLVIDYILFSILYYCVFFIVNRFRNNEK